jgi:hypothetical protein
LVAVPLRLISRVRLAGQGQASQAGREAQADVRTSRRGRGFRLGTRTGVESGEDPVAGGCNPGLATLYLCLLQQPRGRKFDASTT